MSKAFIISVLVTLSQARFGQEGIPGAAVQALSDRGNPGEAGTLAGQVPGVLLGGANACDKLSLADEIVATLGSTDDVLAAAIGLVAAEKNFNNFQAAIPTICSDASLPATPELRGITPLVDPGVVGSDEANAISAASVQTPLNAEGLSVADVLIAQGFSNFTAQAADGATEAPAAGNGAADAAAGANNNNNNNNANAGADAAQDCDGAAADDAEEADEEEADNANDNANNNANDNANNNANNNENANDNAADNANANAGVQQSSIAGLDFGKCVPTMDLQAGRAGRKADELTFLPTDPLVAEGQQDALNPNIITNRICDQLTNVCEANQAAKDACDEAQALVQSLGTKDQTTADAFNQALGFA